MAMREHHLEKATQFMRRINERAKRAGILDQLESFLAPMLNLSPYTQRNYALVFLQMAERFGWPFTNITAAEIAKWVHEGKGETQRQRLRVVKMILRWIYDDELPKEIRRLKIRGIQSRRSLTKDDLPTSEEIRQIRDAMRSLRDKAFFMTLVGTGLRIGEMLSLRVQDVMVDHGVTRLAVHGKTGPYKAFVANYALPWLNRWLATFDKEDGHLPLWPHSLDSTRPISYQAAETMLRRTVKRAGIEKPIWLHLFRHRRNTELSDSVGVEKASMLQHYSKGSTVLKERYAHFSDQDYIRMYQESEGLEPQDIQPPEPIDEPTDPIICPRCRLENDARFRFCGGCAQPLVDEALGDIAEAEEVVDEILRALLQNPDLMRQLKARTKPTQ